MDRLGPKDKTRKSTKARGSSLAAVIASASIAHLRLFKHIGFLVANQAPNLWESQGNASSPIWVRPKGRRQKLVDHT
jgi:hypothetical protein